MPLVAPNIWPINTVYSAKAKVNCLYGISRFIVGHLMGTILVKDSNDWHTLTLRTDRGVRAHQIKSSVLSHRQLSLRHMASCWSTWLTTVMSSSWKWEGRDITSPWEHVQRELGGTLLYMIHHEAKRQQFWFWTPDWHLKDLNYLGRSCQSRKCNMIQPSHSFSVLQEYMPVLCVGYVWSRYLKHTFTGPSHSLVR
jgi:hypothetical protein